MEMAYRERWEAENAAGWARPEVIRRACEPRTVKFELDAIVNEDSVAKPRLSHTRLPVWPGLFISWSALAWSGQSSWSASRCERSGGVLK